eukprot:7631194-Pyramimonas_sp.AAC.1
MRQTPATGLYEQQRDYDIAQTIDCKENMEALATRRITNTSTISYRGSVISAPCPPFPTGDINEF